MEEKRKLITVKDYILEMLMKVRRDGVYESLSEGLEEESTQKRVRYNLERLQYELVDETEGKVEVIEKLSAKEFLQKILSARFYEDDAEMKVLLLCKLKDYIIDTCEGDLSQSVWSLQKKRFTAWVCAWILSIGGAVCITLGVMSGDLTPISYSLLAVALMCLQLYLATVAKREQGRLRAETSTEVAAIIADFHKVIEPEMHIGSAEA